MEHEVYVPPSQLWFCRNAVLVLFMCFLCSTLLVVSMTFDRFYSIIRPHKAALLDTVKRAKITVVCIVIFSAIYNIPHLIITSHVNWECVPYALAMATPYGEIYYWISMLVQFLFPFIFLLTMNSFIIHKIRTRENLAQPGPSMKNSKPGENQRNKSSEIQIYAILLLVTFAFLILSTPAYCLFLFVMLIDFYKTPRMFALYYILYNIAHKMQFTNYGINFFLYVISGSKFRTDLRNLFLDNKTTKGRFDSVESST